MNLIKEKWNKEDGVLFTKYLESLQNKDKIAWTKKIVNTQMSLLAIKTPVIKNIVKEIMKGNYLSFLDLNLDKYYECLAIQGMIISKISDFSLMKSYLDKYVLVIDNWALCDLLSLSIKNQEEKYYELALNYLYHKKPFVRRMAFVILFNFVSYQEYTAKIFELMNSIHEEEEYYVNMINSWLFCEMFIKRRSDTIEFLQNHNLNKFTINKGISKCRDSFRVSDEDKKMLLQYKL